MKRPELSINKECPPIRCEVCHQSDLFDPDLNYCLRCSDTLITKNTNETIPSYVPTERKIFKGFLGFIPFMLALLAFAISADLHLSVEKAIIISFVVVPFSSYLGKLLQKAIEHIIRNKNGCLPADMNVILDDVALYSSLIGLLCFFFIYDLLRKQGLNILCIILLIVSFSIFLGVYITLKKRVAKS